MRFSSAPAYPRRDCKWCKAKDETYCPKCVYTYNGKHYDGLPSYGGYSTGIIMNEEWVALLQCLPVHASLCATSSY